jgi:hypothetical protein
MQQQPITPALLTAEQAAEFLNVSLRTFHALRRVAWFSANCQAIEMTSHLRWSRDELLKAALAAPRRIADPEPQRLADARARKPVL